MPPLRLCVHSGITLAFAFVLAASGTPAEPQEARDADRPQKSVRGTLLRVNHRTNTVIMKSDEGPNLSWRFRHDVVKGAVRSRPELPSQQVVEGLGGPRRDRTGDLLIANEPERDSEKVSEGLSGSQERKDDEDETG